MNQANILCRSILSLILGLTLSGILFAGSTPNPLPLVNTPLVPSTALPGGASFKLTVNGTGFVSGSVVDWNGGARTTSFVSAFQLTAAIPAPDIAKATTASITVTNPAPGGGTSNTVFFTVTVPKPAVAFSAGPQNPTKTGGGSIAVGDFNRDGKLDLVITNIGFSSFTILLGNGDGTFQPPAVVSLPSMPNSVVAADFNGDGKLDIAMSEQSPGGQIEVLLGNGDGTFQPALGFPTGGPQGSGIEAADLNADGKVDLVVSNIFSGSISVLLGNGDGTFQPHIDLTGFAGPADIKVGDFNSDGHLDLAVVEEGSASVALLFGNGDGSFTLGVPLATGNYPVFIACGDFNGDGILDLAVSEGAETPESDIRVFLGKGDGSFRGGLTYSSSADLYEQVVAADVNGDGILDLIVAVSCCGVHNGDVAILLGKGDGTFGPARYYPRPVSPVLVAVADLNSDSAMDIVPSTNKLSVLLQTPVIFSPGHIQFGTLAIGSSGSPQATTMTNVGWGPLQLTGVSIVGANAGDFSQTNNCPASLAQGASCAINVTFAPTSGGTRSATINVGDSGAPRLQGVTLKGTGTFAGLSPSSVNFGSQAVGTSSNPQTVTLTNLSSSTTFSSIKLAITGVNKSDFSETSDCGSTLAAGAHCSVTVVFTPQATGSRRGTLNATLSGTPNPPPVPLTGNGD